MMRLVIIEIVVLQLLLGCGQQKTAETADATDTLGVNRSDTSIWSIQYATDIFGDSIPVFYVGTRPIRGTYSDSTTSDVPFDAQLTTYICSDSSGSLTTEVRVALNKESTTTPIRYDSVNAISVTTPYVVFVKRPPDSSIRTSAEGLMDFPIWFDSSLLVHDLLMRGGAVKIAILRNPDTKYVVTVNANGYAEKYRELTSLQQKEP